MTASMGWDVLGMLIVGLGAAAVLYAALHALRKAGFHTPGWALPSGIGAAMLLFTIWNEYTWFPRVRDQLPDHVQVLDTGAGGKAWRPWTFVVPMVTRFSALEPSSGQLDKDGPIRVRILLVERWQPTRFVTLDVDCASERQRMVAGNGTAQNWQAVAGNDPVLITACANEGGV
ncbi:hypothetical protein [Pontibaca salina]|uniref:Uncharacterized protein n=1 Tax=Pontibaca salina TaxID=2795731 RepID=A0A934HQF1_9RHOB|nr:hypothetical protein [Pontibaca salina]MBI6629031.1 hypothetical protein [Pontibaca salina]